HTRVAKLIGKSSFSERKQIIEEFASSGGILIVSAATSTRIPEMAAVIFYDLPLNPNVLDARIGQFVRLGRHGPIRVFAFADETNALTIERLQ
ncbi:helicase-related protein, partial [Salmonella sp. SAL4457]|uniref:helicase-related protein n=1 Tax=Salmonella sp. SAL4457 TaxID=3159912 RepID=UPI00397AEE0D